MCTLCSFDCVSVVCCNVVCCTLRAFHCVSVVCCTLRSFRCVCVVCCTLCSRNVFIVQVLCMIRVSLPCILSSRCGLLYPVFFESSHCVMVRLVCCVWSEIRVNLPYVLSIVFCVVCCMWTEIGVNLPYVLAIVLVWSVACDQRLGLTYLMFFPLC